MTTKRITTRASTLLNSGATSPSAYQSAIVSAELRSVSSITFAFAVLLYAIGENLIIMAR